MNREDARNSLIAKVNSNPEKEVDYQNKTKKVKVKKDYKNKWHYYKDKFLKSKVEQSKGVRRTDNFFKISFGVGALGLLIFFMIAITSPNQFTKELIYRKNDSIVYDAKNKPIGKITQKRENGEHVLNIEYDQLNQSIINSVVGTEDAKFFSHHGVDILSTGEKTIEKILHKGNAGGSTITQQIIGETHIGRIGNQSVLRKIREIFLSTVAETQLPKNQILSSYLNYFSFGQGNVRGVELASRYFFDKSISDADYVQSAILAGTLNMPSLANPLGTVVEDGTHYNKSNDRLSTVLLSNYHQGYLKQPEYFLLQQAKVENSVKLNKKGVNANPYQSYIDTVAEELQNKYNINPFVKTLKIYTNMDKNAQKYADEIIHKKHVYIPNNKLNFGFIVSKTKTGEITAVGGGKQYRSNGAYLFNNATSNAQQPGSAFKPIIDYSPTFEFLHWSDRAPISNAAYKYPDGTEVNNVDMQVGGTYTMDNAIATSRNLTALRAMEAVYNKIGMDGLTEYLNRFHFNFSKNEVVPAYGIGGLKKGVTPLQMNAAYATFGNGGKYIEPWTIRSFEDEDGVVIKHQDDAKQIIDEKTAFMTSTTLERSTQAPGSYVALEGYNATPYAAKSGTSNWGEEGAKYGIPNLSAKDAWFVGYTSEYTMSAWAGYDANEIKKGYYLDFNDGSHGYPARVWVSMMEHIANGKETSYLKQPLPSGIVAASFDGNSSDPYRAGYINAYFYEDNKPTGRAIEQYVESKPKKKVPNKVEKPEVAIQPEPETKPEENSSSTGSGTNPPSDE